MYISAIRGNPYLNLTVRSAHEIMRGIAYQCKALKEIIAQFPAYRDQLQDFISLEAFHLKYPVGKQETKDQLGRTWVDVTDPPQIPAFGHESINMLLDNVLVPILNGSKRWSFEQAAKASQPLLLNPFIAEAMTAIKAKHAEETTAPGPTRAGQAAAEIGIDELANATSSAGPPLPAEIKTLEFYFERKKSDCC